MAEDKYGIGYSGIAYIDQPVKVIAVSADGKSFVPATYEAVALATYPLSRLTFFNVNKAPGKPLDPLVLEFIKLMYSREGQEVVVKDGYMPLSAAQAQAELAKVQK